MKISIIVPVYNGEKTICTCVDSLLAQTLPDIEILVIDDGSTDNTLQILQEYGDRIRLLTQENGGQGMARNRGIKEATGDYVGFVDADDTVEPGMFARMYSEAVTNKADFVQCAYKYYESPTSWTIKGTVGDLTMRIDDRADYFDTYVFKARHSYEACNKLIKRTFLLENHIEFGDNKIVYAEDLLFNLRLALYVKNAVFLKAPYYNYMWSVESHSQQHSAMRVMRVYKLFELFSDEVQDDATRAVVGKMATLIIFLYYCRIADDADAKNVLAGLLAQKKMCGFIKDSRRLLHRPHQKLIMQLILSAPLEIKRRVIRSYYRNMK